MEVVSETTMVSLVGEQPVPNLLALLHARPRVAVLVCTKRTRALAERVRSILEGRKQEHCISVEEPVEVDPYNMADIETRLRMFIEKATRTPEVVFNLTGGTKPMALTAYRLAERFSCPFLYVQSEGRKSIVYRYGFTERGPELEKVDEIAQVIDIDYYLKAHLGGYTTGSFKNEFEEVVHDVLKPELDEVKHSVKPEALGGLDIDLVLRCGNHVGIAEVKTGKKALSKEGIDQLNTAAEQRFLGTYTERFLILDREYETNNRQLADAHRITVIELPSAQTGGLSPEDREKLIQIVKTKLGG